MAPVSLKDLRQGLEDGRWHQVSASNARLLLAEGYEVQCRFLMGKWRVVGEGEIGEKPNMRYKVRKQSNTEGKDEMRLSLEAMGRESDREVIRVHARLQEVQRAMDTAILATPTGKRRNALTEMNMQIMLLEEGMKTALTIRVNEGEG